MVSLSVTLYLFQLQVNNIHRLLILVLMCHNKELFTTLNPLQKSADVVLGDGRTLQAIGKGKIILEINLPNGES